jgi:membrane protein DedA with SNARE-associated domain
MGDDRHVSHIAAFIYAYGYPGVFSLLMLGIVGLPVPDEWLLIFAGYLVHKGHFHIVPTLAVAVLGSVCGISVSYYLGHTLGISFVHRYGQWFHITEEKMGRIHAWFDRIGRWSLLVGYFIPGVRHLAGFAAGTSKLRFPEFALFAYTGAFVWSVSFVAIGYFSGKEWESTSRTIHRDIVIGAVLAAIMILVYMLLIRKPRRKE